MYVSSEMTVGPASAVGTVGNGLLVAQNGSLQNVVILVTALVAVTGAATLTLDAQYGDNMAGQGWLDTPHNPDTAWASGAIPTTGLTLPTALNASASLILPNNGAFRALRLNFGVGTMTAGQYKIQISAEDWKG